MDQDEPEAPGIPEWVVTFGDMMSLLLTFFIMLVSLSEIKEEDQYQAMVDSLKQQFGYKRTLDALAPGDTRPRAAEFSVQSTTGRARKKHTARGGVPEKAPVGEDPHLRIVRPGQMTAIGSVVFFEVGSANLDQAAQQVLRQVAESLRGKPQKIEVRGHVSAEFAARTAGTQEAMMLGFQRAAAVERFLVTEEGIQAERFRLSSAGNSEPMQRVGGDARAKNPRVEVFMLDEKQNERQGTASERAAEVLGGPAR